MKKLLSAAAALCIAATSAGCEKKTDKETKKRPQQTGTRCEIEYFAFDVKDSFEVKDVSKIDDTISMYFLEIPDTDIQVSVYEMDSNLTPKPYMEDVAEMYSSDEYFSSVKWDTIESGDLTKTSFSCECIYPDGSAQVIQKYYVFSEGRIITFDESFPLTEKSRAEESSKKILSTVEYISETRLPTSEWTEETDYFSVTADPVWCLDYSETRENICYVGLKYAQVDSKKMADVWVDLEAYYGKEFKTPEEYLDNVFSGIDEDVKRTSGKFRGCDAQIAEYSDDEGYFSRVISFEENGIIYNIGCCQIDGDKKTASDIEKLLEGFEVKSK